VQEQDVGLKRKGLDDARRQWWSGGKANYQTEGKTSREIATFAKGEVYPRPLLWGKKPGALAVVVGAVNVFETANWSGLRGETR